MNPALRDFFAARLLAPVRRSALAMAGRPLRLLEICRATGHLRGDLYGQDSRVTLAGVECDAAMRSRLRRKNPNLGAIRADARALPVSDGAFDIAVLCFILHTLAPGARRAVLDEAMRVSRGLILVDYCLAERNLHYPAAVLAFLAERCMGSGHFRAYLDFMREGGLFGLCGRAGLAPERHMAVLGGVGAALLVRRPLRGAGDQS